MRLKIPGNFGKSYGPVKACQWPRLPYEKMGKLGGRHYGLDDIDRDLAEVRDYLARNPHATIHDVALECNMSDGSAQRYRAKARAKV